MYVIDDTVACSPGLGLRCHPHLFLMCASLLGRLYSLYCAVCQSHTWHKVMHSMYYIICVTYSRGQKYSEDWVYRGQNDED